MINVTRSSMPSFEEYCDEIKELWESRWLTNNGAKHRQLENDLKAYLGVSNITLYTNGHLALENALEVLGFQKGGEIITTPFTFASTTHSIFRSGFVPVFCDVNDKDFTINVDKIEGLITSKTVAIMPVHVYGNLCDVEAIQKIADRHGLKVIYDAAHAFGVRYKGKSVASYGDLAMFSFHATKVYNTIEGGALCYSNDALAEKLNDLKNFGMHSPEEIIYVGGNAKMNEFQAAMGICNLRHIDGEIEKRKKAVERYRELLGDTDGIILSPIQEDVEQNYAYFPAFFDGYKYTRDEVFEKLKANDIIARKYFYPLTNSFECYKGMPNFDEDKTPIAKHYAERVLTLPLYADLTLNDVDTICKIILE